MAYNTKLANRIREFLLRKPTLKVEEKKQLANFLEEGSYETAKAYQLKI